MTILGKPIIPKDNPTISVTRHPSGAVVLRRVKPVLNKPDYAHAHWNGRRIVTTGHTGFSDAELCSLDRAIMQAK